MNHIVVRAGKGNKDQLTLLPAVVKTGLSRHVEQIMKLRVKEFKTDAAFAFGALGVADKQAVAALTSLKEHQDEFVRKEAVDALKKIEIK